MDLTCKDCKYYLPVDVFRGLCKITKEQIFPEDPCCARAEKLPKCKFCARFVREKEYLGKCMDYLAYPDMVAKQCKSFEWSRPR